LPLILERGFALSIVKYALGYSSEGLIESKFEDNLILLAEKLF
jgi:hypothetical protein